ncbi:PBECR2 nuclease fold domain-containing protein [Candidatus Magnetomonas plexicatena]|uniref:PBECR2 nuclease fold domain-containing protein n=1 Tax=Candidatus Magnetomonas plexicatena TaxID=2552947 RepID=UPI001C76FDDF|nr:hypothetical protein E2O03_007870 [Nitrospirales bacterium LBB_01]
MIWLDDVLKRKIRLTDERLKHIEAVHPEMFQQFDKIKDTLAEPDIVVRSISDSHVELFYRYYMFTPVGVKYMCVVVKQGENDFFVITSYFTDTIKRGVILWEKK